MNQVTYISSLIVGIVFLFIPIASISQPTFTNISSTNHANQGSSKEGGAVWADFNEDGWLDILVNTSNNTPGTRLFQSDGTFTDVTTSLAGGLDDAALGRSVIWGDLNNDGHPDFIRNWAFTIEIYINQGSPGYTFGLTAGGNQPNVTITQLQADGCSWGGG
ncbi:MAG: VCBS repeat-containing protein [Bacteroidetes bacterium]|nr:VCBS repeat-containing protein [Bacteroidota bacterium]MDA1122317.1 VCBS repeat-containing protein [Bacteroidota bacterium]